MNTPTGVATDGTRLAVADSGNHRVLIYHPVPTAGGAVPSVVLGQPDLTTATPNNGGLGPASLNLPLGVAIVGMKLVVADAFNHRVLIWNAIPTSNFAPADVVVGQLDFATGTSGLAADRMNVPAGVASDGTRLVVADDNNNRVLIFHTLPTSNGASADLVLGQPDFVSSTPNNGGLGAQTLWFPIAATIDGSRLLVADNANHRVLVWNSFPTASSQSADVVLGQPDFATNTVPGGVCPKPDARSLRYPRGVAVAGGCVFVGDSGNHRVVAYDESPSSPSSPASPDDDDDGCGLIGLELLAVLLIVGRIRRRGTIAERE
jgi:hypothetical protein